MSAADHKELVEQVADPLETVARRGRYERDVFRDWTTAMLTALTGQEDEYVKVVQSYPNDHDRGDREADLFAEAFGKLQRIMAETNRDVLGEVYEHLGLHNDENGQHFTPHAVCQLKTELTIEADAASVRDPACGSGRLLVEASKTVPEAFYFGRDNDRLCAKMAALNMCFFNLDAVVIYGDSLKLTRHRAWKTTRTPSGGTIREVDPDREKIIELDEVAFHDGDDDEKSAEAEQNVRAETETRQAELGVSES
jgi:type I restriction-modification system DNA methylase subunit